MGGEKEAGLTYTLIFFFTPIKTGSCKTPHKRQEWMFHHNQNAKKIISPFRYQVKSVPELSSLRAMRCPVSIHFCHFLPLSSTPSRVIPGSWASVIQKKAGSIPLWSLSYWYSLPTGCCEAWGAATPTDPSPSLPDPCCWPQGPSLQLPGTMWLSALPPWALLWPPARFLAGKLEAEGPYFYTPHRIHKSGVAHAFRAGWI